MIQPASITTAEQLWNAGHIGRCELIRGDLFMMSPAGPNHGDIALTIGMFIKAHVREHKLGKAYAAETGFVLSHDPDTVRAADVSFVRSNRVHLTPKRGFFPGAPDLAVEVLSPDDTAGEVMAKVEDWLGAGTQEVWIVDPERKSIAVYSSDRSVRVLKSDDELASESLLPGFRLVVAEVFR